MSTLLGTPIPQILQLRTFETKVMTWQPQGVSKVQPVQAVTSRDVVSHENAVMNRTRVIPT